MLLQHNKTNANKRKKSNEENDLSPSLNKLDKTISDNEDNYN